MKRDETSRMEVSANNADSDRGIGIDRIVLISDGDVVGRSVLNRERPMLLMSL